MPSKVPIISLTHWPSNCLFSAQPQQHTGKEDEEEGRETALRPGLDWTSVDSKQFAWVAKLWTTSFCTSIILDAPPNACSRTSAERTREPMPGGVYQGRMPTGRPVEPKMRPSHCFDQQFTLGLSY